MKKTLIIFFAIIILILSGCDPSITRVEIGEYPRLIYVVGIDSNLDLSNGSINLYTGNKDDIHATKPMLSEVDETQLSRDVDFTKPDIYVLSIYSYGHELRFPVQVIDADFVDEIVNSKLG